MEKNKAYFIFKKQKSWILIVIYFIIIIQFTNAIFQVFNHVSGLKIQFIIITILIALIIILVAIKGLIWQLTGVVNVEITEDKINVSKKTFLSSTLKSYGIGKVKSVNIEDLKVKDGPQAMLQLLRIIDKIKVVILVDNNSETIVSGINKLEADELKKELEKMISNTALGK